MSFRYEEVLCPECNEPMVSRKGKYGVFWGCKSFPNCKGTRDSNGKSKQDRLNESIEKSVEKEEWPRNKEDKITWNKK